MAWGKSIKIRKYRPGVRILGIFEMIEVLNADRYVFVRGKPYHPTALNNWSLATLKGVCRYGDARVAELTAEWIAAEEMKAEIAQESERLARDRVTVLDIEFAEIGE